MFRVYDYTDAMRLFGQDFLTKTPPVDKPRETETPTDPTGEPRQRDEVIEAHGFEVHVGDAGRYIVAQVDGKAQPVTVEEYRAMLAGTLLAEAPSLDTFRAKWVAPPTRHELLTHLPQGKNSAEFVRWLNNMDDYDLYDVLAELGYGAQPHTRRQRADLFADKQTEWLATRPPNAAATLRAIAAQFATGGTDSLESPELFQLPPVRQAGGVKALSTYGTPAALLTETKTRMFAA